MYETITDVLIQFKCTLTQLNNFSFMHVHANHMHSYTIHSTTLMCLCVQDESREAGGGETEERGRRTQTRTASKGGKREGAQAQGTVSTPNGGLQAQESRGGRQEERC